MRELSSQEIFEVGGGVNFTSPITPGLLNSVSNATAVGRMLSMSFGAGYFFGSYLNERLNLSTKIVDALM